MHAVLLLGHCVVSHVQDLVDSIDPSHIRDQLLDEFGCFEARGELILQPVEVNTGRHCRVGDVQNDFNNRRVTARQVVEEKGEEEEEANWATQIDEEWYHFFDTETTDSPHGIYRMQVQKVRESSEATDNGRVMCTYEL